MRSILAILGGADCERVGSGWLAQPSNAVSSLAYAAVGFWLLWRARATGLAMVAVGIGSFAYHGPQPGWARAAHDASIVGLGLVVIGRQALLLVPPGRRRATTLLEAWKRAAPWFAPALAAYWAGRTASSLCRPASAWQFHAAWHASSALALGVLTRSLAVREGRQS